MKIGDKQRDWGPLHMSPVTGLARLPDEFCGMFVREISARSTRINSRNTTKMVEHKLILFATVRTLWTLLTLLIKLFRILLKWKYIQDQNCTFLAAIWWKRSYFVENVSSRSPECSYGKIFIPVTEISVTGPARPLIWTHRYFYKEKSGEARSRKPSQPGWPGSYEEALLMFNIKPIYTNNPGPKQENDLRLFHPD